MPRIIVHIGTHKTGTTTIQRTLSENRQELNSKSIYYPDYTLIGRKPHYAHLGIANALAGDHPRMSEKVAEKFFKNVRLQSENYDTTIISAESMYRQVIGDAPQNAVSAGDYWKSRHKYIKRIYEVLGPAEITMVVRRQADFAESMYQEHVKVTRYGRSFSEFLKEFWFHFEYYQQAKAWCEVFGNIKVLRFDDIKGNNITEKFLSSLEVESGPISSLPNQNQGLSHDAVILKRILNVGPYPRERLGQYASQLINFKTQPFNSKLRSSFFESEETRDEFQRRFLEDNERLALKFIGTTEPLFKSFDDERKFGDLADESSLSSLAKKLVPPVNLPLSTFGQAYKKFTSDPLKPFEIELPKHRIHFTPNGKTLVVTFDNAGAPHREPPDRLPWGHKFLTNEGHSVLGVIAKSSDWYRDPELHTSLLKLKSEGFFECFSKVVMTGSSMGGFGATAFASLSPGCRVLAFNPQSTLRSNLVPWETQHKFGRKQNWDGEFSDGAAEVLEAESVFVIYDPYLRADRLHAERFKSKNVHLLKAFFMGHGLPESLLQLGVLKEVMRRGIDGTLDPGFLSSAIRKRRDLTAYKKQIIGSLAKHNHPSMGLRVSKWAIQEESEQYFQQFQAIFLAAMGDLPRAGEALEKTHRSRRARKGATSRNGSQ